MLKPVIYKMFIIFAKITLSQMFDRVLNTLLSLLQQQVGLLPIRSSYLRCSVRKGIFRNFAKNTPLPESLVFSFFRVCNFIKKETLAQVFSCKVCEISKNTFSYRTSPGDCFCPINSCLFPRWNVFKKLKNAEYWHTFSSA